MQYRTYVLGNTTYILMQRLTHESVKSTYKLENIQFHNLLNYSVLLPVPVSSALELEILYHSEYDNLLQNPSLIIEIFEYRWIHFVGKSLMRFTVNRCAQIIYEAIKSTPLEEKWRQLK